MGNGKDFAKSDVTRKLVYPMRLDLALVEKKVSFSRSRAEAYIRDGHVSVNGVVEKRASKIIKESDVVKVGETNPYVSRAALKLVGANKKFKLNFSGKIVLDVGSSTGGFTEYALKHGATKVIAVDVGTDQMHPSVSANLRVELHEKTDIRDVYNRKVHATSHEKSGVLIEDRIDIVVGDVSFISLRYIVPHVLSLVTRDSRLILMCKPQFEAGKDQVNKGVIKNESMRRKVLADFEAWLKTKCVVLDKVDSDTPGEKGNIERFFLCKPL